MAILLYCEQLMKPKTDPHEEFEKFYSKAHAGYVLITCCEPSGSGEMEVKMTYGGSAALAQLLLDGAHGHLEDAYDEENR
jgi:hypothetical protein